ncbi:MAG: sigma-54 dependent transcriptional regulator [Candidatus Sumerlaeaceae bacterium]|nr:sigma-54 dependent transcriptional regulator [Candidatus Sumerlaeaceae bacterium]
MASILIIDDEPVVRDVATRILSRAGHNAVTAGSLAEGMKVVNATPIEVMLLDIYLPDGRGDELIPDFLRRDPQMKIIVISGDVTATTAVAALKRGAFDYVTKPFTPETLLHVVAQGCDARRLAIQQLTSERDPMRPLHQGRRLPGTSPEAAAVNLQVDAAAAVDSAVLICGESGTGKELVARLIHDKSSRATGPFVVINCAAVPRLLMATELFGSEPGSRSETPEPRKGLLELADGGTVYLDELTDVELPVQRQLLAVLRDKMITRAGGDVPRSVDVRIVAATSQDLQSPEFGSVADGKLVAALSAMTIKIPPLRERPQDIETLAFAFLREKSLELGRRANGFSEDVLRFLRRYSWPGNARELRNMVERLLILSDNAMIQVDEETLRRYCFQNFAELRIQSDETDPIESSASETKGMTVVPTLAESEREYLMSALRRSAFDTARAAAASGIPEAEFAEKIATHGLQDWIDGQQTRGTDSPIA